MHTNNSEYEICGGNVWVTCWITQTWDFNETKSSDRKSVYTMPCATLCLLSHTVLRALKWNILCCSQKKHQKSWDPYAWHSPVPRMKLSLGSKNAKGDSNKSRWLAGLTCVPRWRILAAAQHWSRGWERWSFVAQPEKNWLTQKRGHKSMSNEVSEIGKENKHRVCRWICWCLVCAFLSLFFLFLHNNCRLTSRVKFSEVCWLFIVKA